MTDPYATAGHIRASTDAGPDYCKTCSEAVQEWVTWPCPVVAALERTNPNPAEEPR
jgi:hypothetical protein